MILKSVKDLSSHIVEALKSEKRKNKSNLLLIGGCSRSGKSYIANEIKEILTRKGIDTIILELDAWLISKENRRPASTVLERYEIGNIINSIRDLQKGYSISPPLYDAITRRRIKGKNDKSVQQKNGIIIVDGVITLAIPELLDQATIKIFINIPDTLRKKRLAEFYLDYKKVSKNEFDMIFNEREKEEVPFIKSTKRNADLVFFNA